MDFDMNKPGAWVKDTEASEGIADIPSNKTLFVHQLTAEEAPGPDIAVPGQLRTIEDVFDHYKPNIKVDLQDKEGNIKGQELQFRSLADFTKKGIIRQSELLQELAAEQEYSAKFLKQLTSNRTLHKVLADPEAKAAYLAALESLIREIEEAEGK